jgi:poly-gamma-glutamate system protein
MRSKLYWRPSHVPARVLMLLLSASLVAFLTVESYTQNNTGIYYDEMLQASRLMKQGMEALQPIRARVEPINPEIDPLRSGFIGVASSPITSNSGHLVAKRATLNPNWAAVVVRLLAEAGVAPGDKVAVAVSGSFPALNLAVYSAIQTLELEAVIIASASASQWGANISEMTWIDMSRELRQARLLTLREAAVSLGAEEDRGIGLPARGIASIRASIEKAGVPLLLEDSLEASIAERLAIYRQGSGEPIKVLINVGGGSATTGPDAIDHYFDPGLSYAVAARAFTFPSVMGRFLADGIPVINLTEVKTLAFRYGLPYPPPEAEAIGAGGVYQGVAYRRWLAALMIGLLLALTAFVMRSAHIALAAEEGDARRSKLRAKV